jgi:serine/threonine protein kinase/WD40 repeat protein
MLRLGLQEVGTAECGARCEEEEGQDAAKPDKPPQGEEPNSRGDITVPMTEKPGGRIGRYRLIEEIGHGGCGVVYMAEQEEPVRRRVALKVIKLGMDTRQVVARFEAERQALALMDHPNIARVLDAGATALGRPYFVMELVGGLKITDYCDRNRLTTRQRLELFVQVCRAIQHAHQKGVIHRDIKPSNVLVATHDGVPVPKVIDFGIAKATQGRLTDQTVFTAFEQFLGTPAYMSPEQAQLGGLDVDTRSDIYSLGVLLYELLTGKTPFDGKELLAAGLEAMRRTIQEKEPPTPSTRLKQDLASQHIEIENQKSKIANDLDWIVMKCLEKDRDRRYDTANGLARDIERHLNLEPVIARPPSTIYAIHKFIRRNRLLASAVTAVATVLVLGIAGSSWEAARALRAERQQSRLLLEAQTARRDATEKLWESYLAQARALRMSGQAGRRFESLGVLRKAAAIRPSPALRNEAIACMVLPDIQWRVRKGGTESYPSTSLDPTFERYAVCERTGTVAVRRMLDDSEIKRLPEVGAAAISVCQFSPDGKFLPANYADGRCRIWDWAKTLVVLEIGLPKSLDFGPDGKTIGISDGTNMVLRSLPTGQDIGVISLHGLSSGRAPGALRFDPFGRRLALWNTEADTNVSIVDIRSGQTLLTLGHSGHVFNVAWHANGKYMATGCGDKTLHIWDLNTGERIRKWNTESVISMGFSHSGTILASSGWDGYTRLWDFGTAHELISTIKNGYEVTFSPDDRRLCISSYNADACGLDFFDLEHGLELRTLYESPEGSRGGTGFLRPLLDRSGRLLAFNTQDGIALWNVHTMQQISRLVLDKEKGARGCLGFDADGENVIVTGPQGLFRCAITTSQIASPSTAEQLPQPYAAAPVSPKLTLGLGPPTLVSKECADSDGGRTGWISANGKFCAIVGDNHCQVFRTDTFEKVSETGTQLGMRFGDLSPDGLLFASGAWHAPGVKVWDTRTGELVKRLPADDEHKETTATVAFSPDGRNLVVATTYEICFWEVGSWSITRRLPGNNVLAAMAFSNDGRTFASTHLRNKICLRDATTGQVLAELEAPNSGMIGGLAFNQDGTQLFARESVDAVRMWDLGAIRRQLAEMGLDWEQLPYQVASSPAANSAPVAARPTPPVASQGH